jgi:hypothetical protein
MARKLVVTFAAICVLISIGWFVRTFRYEGWDFRNNLWAPAYLLVHGESPYRISILFDSGNAVWFPQVIGVFFPLGWLSQHQAANLWLLINVLTTIGVTTFLVWQAKEGKPTPLVYGVALLGVFLFPPTIAHLVLGQVDLLLIAAILAGTYMIEKHDAVAAAFCLAFALTKPQLCFLVIPSALISPILKGKWKEGLQIAGLTGVFVLALTIPLWVAGSSWIDDFVWNLRSNPNWLQPALLTQLQLRFGLQGFILWILVASSCLALSIVLWTRLVPHRAVLWTMALTTIAAPYLWSWDFTLLLPVFVDTAMRLSRTRAGLVLFSSWVATLFFSVWSRRFDNGDNRLWWLPLMMLLGLVWSFALEHKPKLEAAPSIR